MRNLAVSEAVAPLGLYYAPDPSSQIACSIGGNVAENAGGVHCLKYGLTVHNIIKLEVITMQGDHLTIGHTDVELSERPPRPAPGPVAGAGGDAGSDTGVPNALNVDGEGSSINDESAVIDAGDYRNHGAYVSAVARQAGLLVQQGYLLAEDADRMVDIAGESQIGKPDSCD